MPEQHICHFHICGLVDRLNRSEDIGTSKPSKINRTKMLHMLDPKNRFAQPFAAQGYDSMGICLKAIENAAKANGNKIPTRAQVTDAIRALKDYPGITGKINFNSKGDLVEAQYFVIQVVSPDPAKWADNTISETITQKPPE